MFSRGNQFPTARNGANLSVSARVSSAVLVAKIAVSAAGLALSIPSEGAAQWQPSPAFQDRSSPPTIPELYQYLNERQRQRPLISEVRGGFYYHQDSRLKRVFGINEDYWDGFPIDANVEFQFRGTRFETGRAWTNFLVNPKPRVGLTMNFGGGLSHVNAGFAWNRDFGAHKKYFFETTLGAALHDGYTEETFGVSPTQGFGRRVGCSPLVHTSASLGYNLRSNIRVMGTVEHLGNFEQCAHNDQLTNMGVRIGYRFK